MWRFARTIQRLRGKREFIPQRRWILVMKDNILLTSGMSQSVVSPKKVASSTVSLLVYHVYEWRVLLNDSCGMHIRRFSKSELSACWREHSSRRQSNF